VGRELQGRRLCADVAQLKLRLAAKRKSFFGLEVDRARAALFGHAVL
jgi:hypothetical protein